MDISILAKQNPWWAHKSAIENDPHYAVFSSAKVRWIPRILKHLDLNADVLYTLRGPRQVGKTTLLKMMVKRELDKGRQSADVLYYSCDDLTTPKEFFELLESYVEYSLNLSKERKLVLLDEVSSIKNWQSGAKHFVDLHGLKGLTLILTGSSAWDLKHAVEMLPGRKGEKTGIPSKRVFLPPKFSEYIEVRDPEIFESIKRLGLDEAETCRKAFFELMIEGKAAKWIEPLLAVKPSLDRLLEEYLITGGVMSAVNEFAETRFIKPTTYAIYAEMIYGDVGKLGRDRATARKIISSVLKHVGSTVSWNTLAKENGIPSVPTAEQYVELLESLFVVNTAYSLDLNTGLARLGSDKKLYFSNPFFMHALVASLRSAAEPFNDSIAFMTEPGKKAWLMEAVVCDHLRRLAYSFSPNDLYEPTNSVFYFRNKSGHEIDFMLRTPEDVMVPVEVKYRNQLDSADYRPIGKFSKGIMVSKDSVEIGSAHPTIPVSVMLMFA